MTDKQFAVMDCEVKSQQDDDRILRFIGSTATRDRMGDEISVKGWQTKNYMKHPVFLWGHNYDELPIGKTVKLEKTDNALLFDVEFAPADVNPKAEQVYQLYKQGFLRATSVGFKSLDSEWIDTETDEEKKRSKKEPDVPAGKRFKKQELLELSAVNVPANPEALITARKKGMTMPEELHKVLDDYQKQRAVNKQVIELSFNQEGELMEKKDITGNVPVDIDSIAEKVAEILKQKEPDPNEELEGNETPEEKEPEEDKEKQEDNKSEPEAESDAQPEDADADTDAEEESKATAKDSDDDAEVQSSDENVEPEDDVDDDDYIEFIDDDE
jgi:HK97 family phage prohead protease